MIKVTRRMSDLIRPVYELLKTDTIYGKGHKFNIMQKVYISRVCACIVRVKLEALKQQFHNLLLILPPEICHMDSTQA